MGETIQKNFNELNIDSLDIVESQYSFEIDIVESQYCLIKKWNALKRKIITKGKKILSDDINDLIEQNSDNETDKTLYEKKYPSNTSRKANSVISNNYSRSDESINTNISNSSSKYNNKIGKYTSKSQYRKREKSIDYVRNNHDDHNTDYNIVLTYKKYIPKRTLSSGTLFDANIVKKNTNKYKQLQINTNK